MALSLVRLLVVLFLLELRLADVFAVFPFDGGALGHRSRGAAQAKLLGQQRVLEERIDRKVEVNAIARLDVFEFLDIHFGQIVQAVDLLLLQNRRDV